jgi:hypothetical protein
METVRIIVTMGVFGGVCLLAALVLKARLG